MKFLLYDMRHISSNQISMFPSIVPILLKIKIIFTFTVLLIFACSGQTKFNRAETAKTVLTQEPVTHREIQFNGEIYYQGYSWNH